MPAVLCGLECFDAPMLLTAGAVAREFTASLDPALDGAACPVEVYKLERVALDAPLAAGDAVLCRLPSWRFDFASLEELHRQLEDLKAEHDNLQGQYARTTEAFVSLNASIEAGELDAKRSASMESAGSRALVSTSGDSGRELQRLRQALAQSEKKQLETKATVMALRSEFMHLVDMMSDAGAAGEGGKYPQIEFPSAMKENARSPLSGQIDKLGSGDLLPPDGVKPTRHVSQPPVVAPGVRRPVGSPRTYRSPGAFTTPRPGARPRGVHQRTGHSAGASLR